MIPTMYFDYDLSHHNTMALSCVADVAIEVGHAKHVQFAIDYAKQHQLPIFVLSGGSNVLLPSRLHACVLLPTFKGITITQESDTHVTVNISGGENWHDIVQYCLSKGWYGLENLALIPGLVGACVIQNIGAYGVQVSDFLEYVTAYDLTNGDCMTFNHTQCQLDYRHSFFKEHSGRYLISHIAFKLHKDSTKVLTTYGDLAQISTTIATKNARTQPNPQDVFEAVVQIRQSKLPDPKILPNCGSFFQNPIISTKTYQTLKQKFTQLPCYVVDEQFVKIPAGWLIDQAGLKGKGAFPILTHTKQALVLTNHRPYHATQDDINAAQTLIIQTVQKMFGITLVREPVWIDAQGHSQ